MKIKTRNELLTDIIHHGKKHPTGWMASFSKNYHYLSNDYFLHHPKVGLFYLKEYQKNPFEQVGVGGKVARKIDEDAIEELRKHADHFGIIQGDVRKITEHVKKGVSPDEIIQGMLTGKNMGMSMPVKGKATQSSESIETVKNHGKNLQQRVDYRFQQMAKEQGLYTSYD